MDASTWPILLFWPVLGGLLGLVVGSFLATLVWRWPRDEGLGGRSRCDSCAVPLGARDLVPLLSFAFARGCCRRCGAAIDGSHPLIELSAGVVGLLAMIAMPGPEGLAGAVLGWFLLALLALDVGHFWLPDRLTLPLLALGLLLGAGTFWDRLLGAAIGGGGLLLVALLYWLWRGREGLGLGDVKLMAALGAWLSPALLAPLLLLAALLGLLLAGLRTLRERGGKAARQAVPSRVPFGACLAAAAFPMWLFLAATGGI